MADGKRTNPIRVTWEVSNVYGDDLREVFDREPFTREYLSQRVIALREVELIEKLPPENSGLYEINDPGWVALYRYLDKGKREFSVLELSKAAEKEDVKRERPDPPLSWPDAS